MEMRTGPGAPRRAIVGPLLATAALIVGAGWADAASLHDTVRTALETNPEIGEVKNDRRAVDQELRQARSGFLPSIDIRAAVGREHTDSPSTRARAGDGDESLWRREAQLTLTQLLFDGFATQSEVERQRARVDSAAYRVAESAEFVALDAIEAHLDILRNREIVELNQANIQNHERILGQVEELERAGRGDISDLRQAEARLARAQESLAIARGNLADAVARYQRIVGERPDSLDEATPPVAALPPSPEDSAAIASTNSPTVQIAAADIDVASAELRASRSGFYPSLNLELGATAAEDVAGVEGSDSSAQALLVLRYNLFRGGADVALEREAFHRLNEARSALRDARREAEAEARFSYNALERARAQTEALRANAEAQRRTRDAYASQFDIGQRDLLDLLDSENELFLARVNLTSALFTEQFAVYRVLAVVGDLLDTLEVGRPREHISIHREPGDEQTPEAIEEKSQELYDAKAEPRPLRGEERGEPPADNLDAQPFTGSSVPEPDNTGEDGGMESGAATPSVDEATADAAPATSSGGVAEYDSFSSFWAAVTGDAPAPTGRAEAGAAATAEAEPAASTVTSTSAPADEEAGGTPEYDSFGSFLDAIMGRDGGAAATPAPVGEADEAAAPGATAAPAAPAATAASDAPAATAASADVTTARVEEPAVEEEAAAPTTAASTPRAASDGGPRREPYTFDELFGLFSGSN